LLRPTLILAALLAAGCATAPPPPAPDPPPAAAVESETVAAIVLQPMKPRVMPVFGLSAGPDLEPLPPPVGDLWERIVEGSVGSPRSRLACSRACRSHTSALSGSTASAKRRFASVYS
jgi:hypothetical protein